MKVLLLCNMMPGAIREAVSGDPSGGALWVDHVLSGLRQRGLTIHVLCPGDGKRGEVDGNCSYETFSEGLPYVYMPQLEAQFGNTLDKFQPHVIHIWGTEYGHTLAMVNAAEKRNLLDCLAISIQGLCSVAARHYNEGVPYAVQRGNTFRDLVRRDNLLGQQEKFRKRGALEVEALKKVRHVIGRTRFDDACTRQIHPQVQYHFCNETLRKDFYEGQWQYETCKKHRIFASGWVFPYKGMHYLLEAFAQILKKYPDATLAVPGKSFLNGSPLRQTRYQKYLADLAQGYGLADKIEFLGKLSGEGMRQAYLDANVFALPSTIENSPNALGEAMILGLPCVASNVGGVSDLMTHDREGYIIPSTAPYLLSYYIDKVFAMEEKAEALGQAAREHALKTHDPEKNLAALLGIYEVLS